MSQTAEIQSRYLDYDQAAAYVNCSSKTLKKRVSRNEVDHIKLGSLVRFRTEDLDKMMNSNLVVA